MTTQPPDSDSTNTPETAPAASPAAQISPRSILLGTILAGFFAFLTVYIENRYRTILTSNQIAVLPYVLIVLSVVIINPVLGAIHWLLRNVALVGRLLRPFSVAEILIIFIMGSVSAGLSTFGLASQLMPLAGSYFNEHWNNDQKKWDLYITPYLNEAYFVSEPGIVDAAKVYAAANAETEAARQPYRAATQVRERTTFVEEAEAAVEAAKANAAPDDEVAQEKVRALENSLYRLNRSLEDAQTEWETQQTAHGAPDLKTVLATYEAKIAELEVAETEAKTALEVLEQAAFEKVAVFRRGLPEDMRAFPGAVIVKGEDFATYMGRIRRFQHGQAARDEVAAALAAVESGQALPTDRLDAAIAELQQVADTTELNERLDQLNTDLNEANDEQNRLAEHRSALVTQKENSYAKAEIKRLDKEIYKLNQQDEKLKKRKTDLTAKKSLVTDQLQATTRVGEMIAALEELKANPDAQEDLPAYLQGQLMRFSAFDATWRRFLFGEVPYAAWAKPILNWILLIGLTYIVLMAFNVLIFRQWAYNERLIYPLAQLPELMAGADDDASKAEGKGSYLPRLYTNGFFWAGLSIAAVVLGWNVFVKSGVVPEINEIPLQFNLAPYLSPDSFFAAWGGKTVRLDIFFTMIGLAFLIPANISFSLWFFYVMYLVHLLVMVHLGYGTSEKSFSSDWFYTLNFKTALGSGGLIIFALITLWKCRQYLFCAFMPSAVKALESNEQKELRIASGIFLISSFFLVVVLSFRMGTNIWWTCFALFVILTMTIGLVRAVTEGGILGFQAWTGPFHIIRSTVGMKGFAAAPQYMMLMVFYGVLFLDIKTFIAPAMANSIKIRDDLKMRRFRFHMAVALGIIVAGGVAFLLHLMLAYDKGADQMHSWFYNSYPPYQFDKMAAMVKNPPVDDGTTMKWLIIGAFVMMALMWGRQHLFWLPHPIGMIMLVNPQMVAFWSPIFIGWFFKRMTTKYGNKDTYDRVRGLFVGLIVGELLVVFISTFLAIMLEKQGMGIDLNRN